MSWSGTEVIAPRANECKDPKVRDEALLEMRRNPPLMYLTDTETKDLLSKSFLEILPKDVWISKQNNANDNWEAVFIVRGEAFVFKDTEYLELIPKGTLFGVDGPLFQQRYYSVKSGEDCVVMRISKEVVLKSFKQDSKLTLNVARNLMIKHNILGSLITFKTYLRQMKSGQAFSKETLLKYYRDMNSCLHPHANSQELDWKAWLYAIRRLPNNITSTLVFFVTTKHPEILSHPDVSMPIKTSSRPRSIIQTMPGKCVVVLRDLETDLFDIMTNLCIHMVESQKIIRKCRSPLLFKDLISFRSDQAQLLKILKNADLSDEEIKGLNCIWPKNLGENLFNILMHYNNFTIDVLQPMA